MAGAQRRIKEKPRQAARADAVRKLQHRQWREANSLRSLPLMETADVKGFTRKAARLACAAVLMLLGATSPAAEAPPEEVAVWKALVEFIVSDNASHPFRVLYFQTDFETAPLINNSMADPTRREYKDLCGLSTSDARAMVSQLQAVNAEPVTFDEATMEPAGLKVSKKKSLRARYIALSRVVFDPSNQHAWLAVDLSGTGGSIMRLDKVSGQWSQTGRCGGWVRSE